jgi:uncharacterized protein (TIGR00297 family)
MSTLLNSVLIGVGVNGLLGLVAWRLRWLTVSGTISSFTVGFIVYYFTGVQGWLILLLFFATANVLGKIAKGIKQSQQIEGLQKKGGRRDWAQVLANGGLATVAALFYGFGGDVLALVMFGSAIAASTADTWSSEVGVLSKNPPISIRTFKSVPTGLSGGISFLGTISGFLGSALIAIAWYGAFALDSSIHWLFLASIITIAGFCGMLADSFLGATLQGHYWNPQRNQITEHEYLDGMKLELCRGIRWIDNDVVNFLSNVMAVLVGSGLSLIVLS